MIHTASYKISVKFVVLVLLGYTRFVLLVVMSVLLTSQYTKDGLSKCMNFIEYFA